MSNIYLFAMWFACPNHHLPFMLFAVHIVPKLLKPHLCLPSQSMLDCFNCEGPSFSKTGSWFLVNSSDHFCLFLLFQMQRWPPAFEHDKCLRHGMAKPCCALKLGWDTDANKTYKSPRIIQARKEASRRWIVHQRPTKTLTNLRTLKPLATNWIQKMRQRFDWVPQEGQRRFSCKTWEATSMWFAALVLWGVLGMATMDWSQTTQQLGECAHIVCGEPQIHWEFGNVPYCSFVSQSIFPKVRRVCLFSIHSFFYLMDDRIWRSNVRPLVP